MGGSRAEDGLEIFHSILDDLHLKCENDEQA
jgi:hypothetical protein